MPLQHSFKRSQGRAQDAAFEGPAETGGRDGLSAKPKGTAGHMVPAGQMAQPAQPPARAGSVVDIGTVPCPCCFGIALRYAHIPHGGFGLSRQISF